MTQYHKHGFNLSVEQKDKIRRAYENGGSISIRLSNQNLHGNDMLAITQTQLNKIKKAENGVQLNLSHAQIKYMEKRGGFLPLLLIPLITSTVGAAGGLTAGIASAVSAAKSNAEQARHNREMEEANKAALEQMKSGTGVVSDFVEKVPVIGNILSPLLKKIGLGCKDVDIIKRGGCVCKNNYRVKQIGSGLYIEPSEGSGLFLEPWRG